MANFIEPNDINLEVVNRDLTHEEQQRISNHIQVYKAKKQKYAQIAMLTEQIVQLDDALLIQKENASNPYLIEQYHNKKKEIINQLQEIFHSLQLKNSFQEV